MNSEEIEDAAATGFVNLLAEVNKKKGRAKTDPYLQARREKGRFDKYFEDLTRFKVVRVGLKKILECIYVGTFEDLLNLMELYLMPKKNSRAHDEISPKEKLALVLEYLASDSLQRHIASIYRISKSHIGQILNEVCIAQYRSWIIFLKVAQHLNNFYSSNS